MFDVVIVANGKSIRAGIDKLSNKIGDISVLSRSISAFSNIANIKNIIVVTDKDIEFENIIKVSGGDSRTESVKCGLAKCTSEYVLIHDAARPFVSKDLINLIMQDTITFGSSIPYIKVTDSLRSIKDGVVSYVNRDDYVSIQTPQGFRLSEIKKAYESSAGCFYDDSELYAKYIRPIHLTPGEQSNKKITTYEDLFGYNMNIGVGFDVHEYEDKKRPLILGGIEIPFEKSLVAHSDGDVVLHALSDAILSSIHERDIGVLYPDNDQSTTNISSEIILSSCLKLFNQKNKKFNNISIVIMAQQPKLSKYIPTMQEKIATLLSVDTSAVSITATTTENLGIVGETKGIAVLAEISIY